MEKNAAAGRTPSSVPISTPPPAVLNVSYPKVSPVFPVNTNPLSDSKSINSKSEPTNFSLPQSYAEERSNNVVHSSELHPQPGEHRFEKFPSAGTLVPLHLSFNIAFVSHSSGKIMSYAPLQCPVEL